MLPKPGSTCSQGPKLAGPSAMNQSTQPDPDEENDIWQSASIRIKVVWKNARACSKKNVVKWLELAHSVECIRFVYNNAATMARCSRNKMKSKKKHYGETIANGISRCNSGDRQRMEECPCTCHIFPKELIDALFTMEKTERFCLGNLSSWVW